jgi:hypothetical protein
MKECPNCGKMNPDTNTQCSVCGKPMKAAWRFGAIKLVCLSLIAVALGGCACGVGGQHCVTGYTQTQTQPGVWVTTVQYGN